MSKNLQDPKGETDASIKFLTEDQEKPGLITWN